LQKFGFFKQKLIKGWKKYFSRLEMSTQPVTLVESAASQAGENTASGSAVTTQSDTPAPDITAASPYDNNISFLYKQAIKLGVPHRFLLVRPRADVEARSIDTFDLEENRDATFTTLFIVIRQLILQDNTIDLDHIWDIVSKFRGDTYNPLELISIWLHAVPEFRVESPVLLQQVNTFLTNIGEPTRYNSMAEVVNYYGTVWLPYYQRELQKDYQTLLNFVRSQQEIMKIPPVFHSGITLDSITISYDFPTERGINPLPDIFNTAFTSYIVPFVQFNIRPVKGQSDQVERYYKIYKGRSIDARPDYNNVILTSAQAARGQSIYLNVWAGDYAYDEELQQESPEIYEEARTGKKESFNLVTISYLEDLNIIRVLFSSPHTDAVDETHLIERIHTHLPSLPRPNVPLTQEQMLRCQSQGILPTQLVPINEVRISGSFYIYNVDLIEPILFHLIMNDPLFSAYLYLEEGGKSFAEKTRLNIHYREASTDLSDIQKSYGTDQTKLKRKSKRRSAVSATITQEILSPGDILYVQQADGQEVKYQVQTTTPAINVKMTRAASRKVAQQFVDVLSRLFRRYIESRNILNMYLYFVPEYAQVIQANLQQRAQGPGIQSSIQNGQVVESDRANRVDELRKLAGDVFVANYARKCQRPFQPKLIRLDEAAAWQRKYIIRGNTQEERQILSFPKENPKYILVCPDDKYPYPGVMENKTLSNRNVYPYIPCCFRRNQLNSSTSSLNKYYFGTTTRQARVTTSRSGHKMKTGKILPPERLGLIHTSIVSLISQYDEESGEFYRFGVPRSTNSFIHCVALALEYRAYLEAPDREEWVSALRSNLFRLGIHPELLRQELYDMANEDIIQKATDNDVFFDPLLYYRALEILFDCNIYVFANNDMDEENGRKRSLLHLPRHRYFHAHTPVPSGRVVLIIRHWGSESNALEYPQCELIIDQRPNDTRMHFSDSMNELLYPALTFVGRTLSWQIYESSTSHEPTMTCRMNVYSVMNYQMVFGQIPIIGQIIDSAGKARVFALAPEIDPSTRYYSSLRIFVNVPPTAPLNVPSFRPEEASSKLPPYTRLIELFREPISATVSTDGQFLTGLWFPIGDIEFGFYCPCQDFPWDEFVRQYPNINRNSELAALTVYIPRERELVRGKARSLISTSPIQRIRYLNRAARFVDQIVKYLYLVAGRPDNIPAFIMSFGVMLDQNKPDSVDVYDVSKIPRILPAGNDVTEIINRLATYSPTMFRRGKLVFYDQQMVQGIAYQLQRFARNIAGLPLSPSQLRQIQGYYGGKEDFQFNPQYEFILGSLKEYNSWMQTYVPSPSLQQRTIQNLKDNIQTRLNPNAFAYREPYIYQRSGNNAIGSSYNPQDDRFYLIQNVAGGDFLRAIQVAYNWYVDKRNSGFGTEEWSSGMIPVNFIYRISPDGSVIVEQDNSNGQAQYLEILNYGNNTYAAMLPIL
jgi:hypothetical protein